jgi:mannose-6-phosphate isomerase-like protein (cupin superfamily)
MTFPSAPTLSVAVLCCGNEYASEKLAPRCLTARVRNTRDRGAVTVPINAQPGGPNYSVKNAETVAAGKDLRVRLFTLAPGEIIPWHFHSAIADEFFVLDGELTVETRAPDDCRVLGVGQRYRVNAGHQTSNRGAHDCRFLIVQGVGKYDFKGLAAAQDEETRTAGV